MAPKKKSRPTPQTRPTLRQRAEATWQAGHADAGKLSKVDGQRLVHDLQVSQIELEMQNEELRRVQAELADSHDRYVELYDFAPVGYVTLDANGVIQRANLTVVALFGIDRSRIQNRSFTHFVDRESLDAFYIHQQRALAREDKQTCEIKLRRADGTTFPAQLDTIRTTDAVTRATLLRCVITDITASKRTEAALRASEERLRQGVRVGGLGLFEHDHLTGEVYYSTHSREIWGWTAEEDVGLPQTIARVHPEDRPAFTAAVELAHDPKGDGMFFSEHRVIRPDGTIRWVNARSQTSFTGKGASRRPARTIGALVDITERKQAEQQLAASERRFRALTEKAAEDIILMDVQGRIIYESPHEVPLLGFAPGEMTGHSGFELVHPDDQPLAREKFSEVLSVPKASVRGELRMRRKDGRWSWIHFYASNLLHDPAVGAVVLNLHNITKRKEAEAALRASEELNRRTLQALPAHIAVLNQQGDILSVNQAWAEFASGNVAAGFPSVRVGANYLEVCRKAGKDPEAQEALRGIEDVLCGREPQFSMVYLCHGPVEQRWFHMMVVPLAGQEGRGAVISHTDITARRLAEETLRRSHEQLEQRVAERTAELAALNRQLTDQMAVRAKAEQALQRQAALLNMTSDAVIIRELDGAIRYWNHGAERLYGYSQAEAIGRIAWELLATVFPGGTSAFQKELTKHRVWAGEFTQTTKTGHKIIVESHEQMVEQPEGPALVLITNHDITTRAALEEAIVAAGERERERLGQDLHDGLCQLLTAARLKADSLTARLEARAPTELGAARTTVSIIAQALEEARRMARGLEPVEPVPEGLMIALQDLASTIQQLFNIACACNIPEPVLVTDPAVATELFRIAQEATNNAIKHSHAKSIQIRLTRAAEELTLSVSSDGAAFPHRPQSRGMGLKAMRFRAKRIGAKLEIGPGRGGGVLMRCVTPLAATQRAGANLEFVSTEHQMVLSALRSETNAGPNAEPFNQEKP